MDDPNQSRIFPIANRTNLGMGYSVYVLLKIKTFCKEVWVKMHKSQRLANVDCTYIHRNYVENTIQD